MIFRVKRGGRAFSSSTLLSTSGEGQNSNFLEQVFLFGGDAKWSFVFLICGAEGRSILKCPALRGREAVGARDFGQFVLILYFSGKEGKCVGWGGQRKGKEDIN